MNLLYVGTLPPHCGGSATVGAQLLSGCAARGHRVRAIAPITTAASRAGQRFDAAHPFIAVTRFVVPYFENAPDTPPAEDYRRAEGLHIQNALSRLLAEEPPDLVIIGRETFAWHVPDITKRHDIPSVALVHGATSTGIERGTIPQAMAQQLLDHLRKVDCLVLVAAHLLRRFQRWGFQDLRVIQNGVDLQRFTPQPKNEALLRALGIAPDAVVVTHVSNLKSLKRPFDIVASASQTLRQNPQLVYVIVGDGNLRGPMEDACRQQGIADRFRFVGWVDHEEVPAYLSLADIVLMPSESEALALVYLETQACGRTLLASDIAASREVVIDGESGILFRLGDVADLSDKTLRAAAEPERLAAIGRRSRELVAEHAIEMTVDAYVGVFTEIMARRTQ